MTSKTDDSFYLRYLSIRNYRSCYDTTLDEISNLACLIGVNGAGKSNILNSLLFFTRITKGRYLLLEEEKKNFSNAKINLHLLHQGKKIYLQCEFIFDTDDHNADDVLQANIKVNLKNISGKNSWIPINSEIFSMHRDMFERSFRHQNEHMIRHLSQRYLNNPDPILFNIVGYLKNISYYSATQFADPSRCPVSFELDENKPNRYVLSKTPHEKFLHDLYNSWKNNRTTFDKYLSSVNDDGIGLISTIEFNEFDMPSSSYKVKAGGKVVKIDKKRKLIIPSINLDKKTLSPNQLSEGTFKTLAILYYILTDLNQLLIIEEPEACIHHGLLDSVLTLIIQESSKKQIIISTHSDYVLDKLSPENIFIVKRSVEKGSTAKALTKSLTKNSFSALKEYLMQTGNLGEYWKEGGFEYE